MRRIKVNEKCLTVSEIAARFHNETGQYISRLDVLKTAKKIRLDYITHPNSENDHEAEEQRLYSEIDLKRLFKKLRVKVARRDFIEEKKIRSKATY